MKAGIMTFFSANNYGAVLQAYALQKKLTSENIECECIDYKCDAIEKMHQPRKLDIKYGLIGNLKNIIRNTLNRPRLKAFAPFRERIPHSKPYTKATIAQANKVYDAFITGSDQVFNLELTGGDTAYFLDFVTGGKPKISYAASMGKYLEEYKDVYKEQLGSFDLLSFREKAVADKIKSEIDIDGRTIPDPVFLLTGEEWKKSLNISKKADEKYIFVYALFGSDTLLKAAQRLAHEKNCKLYIVTKIGRLSVNADKIIRDASPEKYVELIANAEYVLCDSFHGTAFSLILKKQFYSVLPPKAPERITDLLSSDELKARIIDDPNAADGRELDTSFSFQATESLRKTGEEYISLIKEKIS
ncbi:MAG: polysaccharide pyruvyl transferase family protein [Ruminococcus sp.]|nr:polysaccharide pyruvyl transferase family protein [Ruminococcus sp.]